MSEVQVEFMGYKQHSPDRGSAAQVIISTPTIIYRLNATFDNNISIIKEDINAVSEEREEKLSGGIGVGAQEKAQSSEGQGRT